MNIVKIAELTDYKEQYSSFGNVEWSVAKLVELSKDFPIMEIPLIHLNFFHKYESITTRQMVMHVKAINNADLSFPIILDEDGDIFDGRHRVMKALLLGKETIKAVRFDINPRPCITKRKE